MIDREKINYEARQDKIAEYKEQCNWAMREYCERDCEEHNENCPWYDAEEETWDYEDCFKTKGW